MKIDLYEEWKDISTYGNKYEVSNTGKVRNKVTNKILKPSPNRRGHLQVNLTHNGKGKTFKVHRLVATEFIPNPTNLPYVLHWDDCPENNNVENLRWGDGSDNNNDRVRNGIHHHSKLTHCKYGHEFTEDNTYVAPGKNSRHCRTCVKRRNKLSWRRRNWGHE